MNIRRKLAAAVFPVAGTILLAACPSRVSIATINRDPARYADKDIAIAGRVASSFGAVGTGVYQIDDGSGTVWVYSSNFGVPSSGAKVAVVGPSSKASPWEADPSPPSCARPSVGIDRHSLSFHISRLCC